MVGWWGVCPVPVCLHHTFNSDAPGKKTSGTRRSRSPPVDAGGRVLYPATTVDDTVVAEIEDSEGNRIGVHKPPQG